jgi:malonyl-CoA/methylmalonyl-CoA synthetase
MEDWALLQHSVTGGFAALVKHVMRHPDAPFISDQEGRNFSHADYWALSGRLAHGLKEQGVVRGDRVALQAEKSVESVALFLACARLGAIFLPLNPAYTQHEVEHVLTDAEPRVLIRDPAAFAAGGDCDVEDAALAWNDPIALLYTSGTTGQPKGAVLTHGNIASNAMALIKAWDITANDVLIHALPVFHVHGLFVAMNTVMLSGASMFFRTGFDAGDVLAHMPQATVLMGVPTFYTRLLSHPGLTRDAAQRMRLFISGSAPLLAETHRMFEIRTGHVILERYGMTETGMITSNPYADERRAGTVGFPLDGVDVRIAASQPGEIGVIEVKGPNVFQGYWRQPEKTQAEFSEDGFFRTGDLGSFDTQGYLAITGRTKDLIISGGLNVVPKEVELALDALPGVMESAVIGVPHPDFGESVVAVVEMEARNFDENAMIVALSSQLAKFKTPKRIVAVDALPRNAMGKVQKAELRRQYKDLFC